MEEHETPDPEFVKGFNEGYTIAQHSPEISRQLGEIQSNSPRSLGFIAGREQFAAERRQERYPAWLKPSQAKQNQASPKQKPDRGIEPER